MRIQSIPAVYAFKEGRPVDGFVGALPESQVKQFVQRLGGARGRAVADRTGDDHGQGSRASGRPCQRRGALFADPATRDGKPRGARRAGARADRARRTRQGAASCSASAARRSPSTPRSRRRTRHSNWPSRRRRRKARSARCAPGSQQNPDDHEARFELATALFGAGERESGDRRAVDPVQARPRPGTNRRRGASWSSSSRSWAPTDPLTLSARRRLSSLDVLVRGR